MNQQLTFCVLGAGSYGTALAISLAKANHKVVLWGQDSLKIQEMSTVRQNKSYLPNIDFPDSLVVTSELSEALSFSHRVLIAVPSHAFGEVVHAVHERATSSVKIIWATKGLEVESGRLLQDVVYDYFDKTTPLAVLSGPTFAAEMAKGMPTAISLASTCHEFAIEVAEAFHDAERLRVYINDDFIGLQIGGAIKNVIAIAAGMSDGLGFGANARVALITRGLSEMQRLGLALGAKPETFMGMSGLGDLVLTCTDDQSRNRRFGFLLSNNYSFDEASKKVGQVVEGYQNAREVFALAQRLKIDMPIVTQVYAVLYEELEISQAVSNLLSRARTTESTKSQ